MAECIDWSQESRNPVALVILPWDQGGMTIAHRDADGTLYGCRDVSNSEAMDCAIILATCISEAREKNLAIEDNGGAIEHIANYAETLRKIINESDDPVPGY